MSRCAAGIACSIAALVSLTGCKQEAAPKASEPPGHPEPAATARPVQGGPRWVCDQPLIDYGEVWVDTIVQRQFTFRNAGDQVLTLNKVLARCSCSSAPEYTKEVPPGGTGTITYVLNTAHKPFGPCVEYISFPTNDPATPKAQITLRGFIRTAVDPEVVYDQLYERNKAAGQAGEFPSKQGALFGRVKGSDQLLRVIKLRNTSGRPLSLTMQPLPPNTRFQIELKETATGQEYELTAKVDPPIPVGSWGTVINLQTNIPEQPVYQMNVAVEVPPRVEITPPGLMVIDQNLYAQKERVIKVINNGTTPVDVIGISTSEPRYNIRLLPRDPAKPNEQVINIGLPGGESYQPPSYGELIEVRTNDAEVPLTRIQVLPSLKAPATPRPPDKPLQMYPVTLPGGGG